LFTQMLAGNGYDWNDLPRVPNLFEELALLDQNYHEFSNPQSVFHSLEQEKLLNHRVADLLMPGKEPEPYVPDTATRARARAIFIREHAGDKNFVVDWGWIADVAKGKRSWISQPFAQAYDPWKTDAPDIAFFETTLRRPLRSSPHLLEQRMEEEYQRGAYYVAHEHLVLLERLLRRRLQTDHPHLSRYRAWLQSRRGYIDGTQYLDELYRDQPVNLSIASDYVFVYRFRGLSIPPEVQPWIERGRLLLDQADAAGEDSGEMLTFREHLGHVLLHEEKYIEALKILEPIWRWRRELCGELRIQGRALATLGNAYRITGRRRKACTCLNRAEHILDEHGFSGDLADMALAGLAKLALSSEEAIDRLTCAKRIQKELGSPIGLARSLLIEARRCSNVRRANNCKNELIEIRNSIPGLQNCRLLERILANWRQWISEPSAGSETDNYWGV